LLRLALITPEARKAHGGAQFPRFGVLFTRNGEGAIKTLFRLQGIALERNQSDFPCDTRYVGLAHLSFVVFTAWMASLIQREASWKSQSSAYACANRDTKKGVQIFAPVDRQAAMPEDNVETPFETLPVSAHKQLWFISPNAVQYAARSSCAKGRSS
jgi:hypothetical protein